jgi:transcriptional regulator with XRE-family HTH domain
MLKELGAEINRARTAKGLSLDAAAQSARISNAYLHKLEGGGVKSPSPRVLARVAVALDVPYLDLMERAGYLDEEQLARVKTRAPRKHPLEGQDLSPTEWQEVGRFIRELVQSRG